jgi:uncharacterized membrane protein
MLGALEVIAITMLAALISAVVQYIYKKNIRDFRMSLGGLVTILENRAVLFGMGLNVVALVVYLYALSSAPIISFVYPVFSSTFVFVFLISRYALKEKVTLHRVLGILLVIIGIGLISITFP